MKLFGYPAYWNYIHKKRFGRKHNQIYVYHTFLQLYYQQTIKLFISFFAKQKYN